MSFLGNLLNRFRISTKIQLIIVFSSVIIIGLQLNSAYLAMQETIAERKLAARSLVESLVSQVDYLSATDMPVDEVQALIKQQIKAVRYAGNGYFFVTDTDGVIMMHPIKPELNDQNVLRSSKAYMRDAFSAFIDTATRRGAGFVDYDWPVPGSSELEAKISYVAKAKHLPWVIGTGVYISDVKKDFQERLISTVITTLVLLFVLILVAGTISRNIIRPLQKVTRTMSAIAADKDLSIEMKSRGRDELSEMACAFNTMNGNIKQVITSINSNTGSLASQAEELSAVTMQIQGGISEQKAETMAVVDSVTSLTEVSSRVSEHASLALAEMEATADNVESGNQAILQNITVIRSVSDKVEQAVVTTEKLEDSSTRIGDILEVIKQIAEQTNLLALNAAIEAARAGEQGRGFAVVADEVRTLASRTQESTGSIQAIIDELQGDVSQTASVMRECASHSADGIEQALQCGEALESIRGSIVSLHAMAGEISQSAHAQNDLATEIDANIRNIATVAEQTEAGTLQTAQSSEQLSQMAQDLNALVNEFKL